MADIDDIDQRLPGALFSMDAADNAQVVPTDLPTGPESLWSTAANPEEAAPNGAEPPPHQPVMPEDVLDEDAAWAQMGLSSPNGHGERPPLFSSHGFGVGQGAETAQMPPTPVGAPGAGGVFSAEPVSYDDDVLDEGEVDGELEDGDDWFGPGSTASVFSNGAPGPVHAEPTRPSSAVRAASPFATPGDPWSAWETQDAAPSQAEPPASPPPFTGAEPMGRGAPSGGPASHVPPSAERPEQSVGRQDGGDPASAIAADQHGFDVAVSRLRPEDQEHARVPLSVCGALLVPGEQVLGAVTGQMLGRPAAVVVTRTRVLIVNDRRWQPIVDIFPIDEQLQVRGRHDRHVAALSFADDERLSMIDGITDVEIAIDLAEAVRHPGLSDRGTGSAF